MWSTAPLPPSIFHSISAVESTLYWHEKPYSDEHTPLELTHLEDKRVTRHLYGQQTRDGRIIIGGDRQVSVDKLPDQHGIESNRQHAIELLPFLRNLLIKHTWAGWMPFTRDLNPLIGKIPGFEHLYILTGLSSSGFEQGPLSGKLLADCIHNGIPDPILSAADPARQITSLPTEG
jgi:glycine/D-amino acid oxidase-like deaminating enzyme